MPRRATPIHQEALFVLYGWPYARQWAVDLLTENAAASPAA
jgi:hypothetical protein